MMETKPSNLFFTNMLYPILFTLLMVGSVGVHSIPSTDVPLTNQFDQSAWSCNRLLQYDYDTCIRADYIIKQNYKIIEQNNQTLANQKKILENQEKLLCYEMHKSTGTYKHSSVSLFDNYNNPNAGSSDDLIRICG